LIETVPKALSTSQAIDSLGFWRDLPRPIMAMAPLANVTDCAFRYIIAKYGKPHVFFTEFVSCDGLCSSAYEKLAIDLKYHEIERPIVAQIFGAKPENFFKTAQMVREMKFDGVDINMGCPDKSVLKQGAGCGLIETPELAKEIIYATKEGAGPLPVSVKTRIGLNHVCIDEWIPTLLETKLVAITLHGRTKNEMSKVPAHWDVIGKAADLARDTETLIIGNGDVASLSDAHHKTVEFKLDGAMMGRAIFGNPWLFNETVDKNQLTTRQQFSALIEHIELFDQWLGAHKNFAIMKKHFKAYVNGFDGAKELRMALMDCELASEAAELLKNY
jgi:nifR3 family TIM-barrel protein